MPTAYTIRVREPEARRAEIELTLEARGSAALEVRFPVWTPGSYLVREHQRHVDGFWATDDRGRRLPVRKSDKQTWRIDCGGAARVQVGYRLARLEVTRGNKHIDSHP